MDNVVFVIPADKRKSIDEFSGTLLLATILKSNGLNPKIYRFYEANKEKGFFSFVAETAQNIIGMHPRIVSFYCRCDCYLADIMIAERIKRIDPSIFIVFGGPQADASSYDTINEVPWVDFCCSGEGETTIYPLFFALLTGGDYTKIAGLTYRDSHNNIIQNDSAPMLDCLDHLPFLDYTFIPEDVVKDCKEKNYSIGMDVGRGCPFNCAYCSSSLFWKRNFRMKSAKRIVDEMIYANSALGVERFVFEHDLFTASKQRVLDFLNELKNSSRQFQWACSSRVDTLDEETIAAMAANGLISVYLGVESGSAKMQKLMNKNLKIQDVIHTVTMLTKYGIKVTASFIYALPEETEEDLEDSLQLAFKLYKLGVERLQFHLCCIFRGTQYYNQYRDNLIVSQHASDIVGDFGVAECQDYIKEHINLFSFCYEYETPIRDRFSSLSVFINKLLAIYDNFLVLLPEEYWNKRIIDLYLEIVNMYGECNVDKNHNEIASDYANKFYDGDIRKKLVAVFEYYNDKHLALQDDSFQMDCKEYGIDIRAVDMRSSLKNIQMIPTTVIFKKEGGKLSVFCTL